MVPEGKGGAKFCHSSIHRQRRVNYTPYDRCGHQLHRSTGVLSMRLSCKSVSGCPTSPLPITFLSFPFPRWHKIPSQSFSCNGILSIFPRLTHRFAECEKGKKKHTRRPFLTAPQRRDPTLFTGGQFHTRLQLYSHGCANRWRRYPGPKLWYIPLGVSKTRLTRLVSLPQNFSPELYSLQLFREPCSKDRIGNFFKSTTYSSLCVPLSPRRRTKAQTQGH